MDFDFTSVDIVTLVEAQVLELKEFAAEHEVSVIIKNGLAQHQIHVDPSRTKQVLRNLLSNAIKFSPNGGEVSVELEQRESALSLSVRDQGVGIPEDELELVFDKFVQSTKTKSGAGGTGLGLAICKEIVEAHSGHIWAERNPGGGSIMTFVLPMNEEKRAAGYND